MPEFLRRTFSSDVDVSLTTLVVREGVSLLLGCVIALLYRVTHGRHAEQPVPMMATLVLLTVLIGMISSVIGDNIARAFSLVGALSIVRFRTVVDDTRDTAFVIFAVGVGMAVGAGYLKVPLVTIPAVGVAALLFRSLDGKAPRPTTTRTLVVRLALGASDEGMAPVLNEHTASWHLHEVATARQGAAIERMYHVQLRPGTTGVELVAAMNRLEGVQGVELRQPG